MNFSSNESFVSHHMRLYLRTFVGVNSVLSLVIIVGNTLVLFSIITNIQLRNKCNFFLFSLAVADVLVGVLSIPFWNYHLVNWMKTPQAIIFVYTLWDVLLGVASIMSLLALSITRCFSVLKPFIFSAQRNEGYVVVAIIFPWSFGGLACVTMYYLNDSNNVQSGSYMSAFHFVPMLMILFAYVIMFKMGSKMASQNHGLRLKEDLKAAKTAAIIIACLNVSWLPFFAFQIYLAAAIPKDIPPADDLLIRTTWCMPVLKTLQYSHSAVNPIIYGVRNKEFRRTFKSILYRYWIKYTLCGKKSLSSQPSIEIKTVTHDRSVSMQNGIISIKNMVHRGTDSKTESTLQNV